MNNCASLATLQRPLAFPLFNTQQRWTWNFRSPFLRKTPRVCRPSRSFLSPNGNCFPRTKESSKIEARLPTFVILFLLNRRHHYYILPRGAYLPITRSFLFLSPEYRFPIFPRLPTRSQKLPPAAMAEASSSSLPPSFETATIPTARHLPENYHNGEEGKKGKKRKSRLSVRTPQAL